MERRGKHILQITAIGLPAPVMVAVSGEASYWPACLDRAAARELSRFIRVKYRVRFGTIGFITISYFWGVR